jgi:hypothetical protein
MDTSIFRSSESVIVRSQPVESTLSFRGFARATTRGEALKKKSLPHETSNLEALCARSLISAPLPSLFGAKQKPKRLFRNATEKKSAFLPETRLRGGGVGGGRDGGRGVHLLVTFSLLVVTLLLVALGLLFPPPAAAAAAAAAAVRGAPRRAQNVRPIRAGDVHGFRLFVISTFDVVLHNLILCVGVRSCEESQIVRIETNTKGGV